MAAICQRLGFGKKKRALSASTVPDTQLGLELYTEEVLDKERGVETEHKHAWPASELQPM